MKDNQTHVFRVGEKKMRDLYRRRYDLPSLFLPFRPIGDLFDRTCWSREFYSPSYPNFIRACLRNVYEFLTPWYGIRRAFLCAFENWNGCKVLDGGPSWTYIRNRFTEQAYYTLTFTGWRYRLVRRQVLDEDNTPVNVYIAGLQDMARDEPRKYTEKENTVATGWVLGRRSFILELEKVAAMTPDLEWLNGGGEEGETI